MAIPVVLAVSASDSSGADGVQADLRTLAALKVHGASVVTLVTAQSTEEVVAVEPVAPALVEAQLRAVLGDMPVGAVKVGALGSAGMVRLVAGTLGELLAGRRVPVVVDPVMVSHAGAVLVDDDTVAAYREALLPMAEVATPNMGEAALLAGEAVAATLGDLVRQGEALVGLGCPHVLMSGGQGRAESATDILVSRDRAPVHLRTARLERANMRGLSATLSSAVAAHVAHGFEVYEAIQYAKLFVTGAIDASGVMATGRGPGPVHQMHRLWEPRGSA